MYRLYDFYEDQDGEFLLCSEYFNSIMRFMHTYTEDTIRQENAAQREKLRDRQRAILAADNAEHDRQFCRERFWREFTAGEMRR